MHHWWILFVVPLAVVALARPNNQGVVQLPLRRQHRPVLSARLQTKPVPIGTRHRDNKYRRPSSEQGDSAQPLTRNFTDAGPFSDFGTIFRDEVFTVDVALGTPAKSFNATLDYRWEYSFFFNTGDGTNAPCMSVSGGDGGMPWRRDYDPKASSSAVNNPQFEADLFYLGVPYVPVGCTDFTRNNALFNDTLKIASTSFNVAFVFIPDTWGNLDFYWPSDAILGLKRAYDKSDPTDEYAIYGILNSLPQNVVTVYFDSKETSNAELNGQITLGGVDAQNCDSKWNYVPAVPETQGWSVYVTQFSFGTTLRVKQRVLATVESTTALITAPPPIVDDIIAETGAEYDFRSDTFVVPCAKVGTFPDMVFQMGEFEYRLPDKDYIRQLPHNRAGMCTLMLDGGDYVEDQWTLGSTFGRSYCTLFDYDKNRIGFAKVLH